jgi:hypothetical protein
MHQVRKLHKLEYTVGILASFIFIVFWLVVSTFPSFFLFNPFKEPDQLRRAELALSTAGWLLISTGVPVVLFLYASGRGRARFLLPFFALIYPISLIISQVTIYARTDATYMSYLTDFPIFIFTDILLPVFVLFIWHDLKERPAVDM